MDVLELQTLASELVDDAAVAVEALALAERRYAEGTPASFDSCAHHLSRCYNVIEQMGLRVAKAFENSLDDDKGWRTELIRRLSIRIPSVRPALFSEDIRQPLQELRAFRHVFVHACDLGIDPDKLALILKYGRTVADRLPALVTAFVATVAKDQGLELPLADWRPAL